MFDAAGDGSTDDTTAITDALTAAQEQVALNGGGALVYFPPGIYMVSDTIQVPGRVRLVGAGKRPSCIRAVGGFAAATPVVQLGLDTDTIAFDIRLEHLRVDCNDVADIGVYSNCANEGSGCFDMMVQNFRGTGIYYDDLCSIVGNHGLEVYGSALGSTRGIYFNSVSGQSYVIGATIRDDSGTAADGILVESSDVQLYEIHTEGWTDGIEFGSLSKGTAIGIYGGPIGLPNTNVVNINTTSPVFVTDVSRNGSTYSLFNAGRSEAITTTPFGPYWTMPLVRVDFERGNTTDPSIVVGTTATAVHQYTIYANGKMEWGNGTLTRDTNLYRQSAGILKTDGYIQLQENTDPSAPTSNNAILYSRDNGGGKTQLVVRFPTGAVQVIATEP